MKFSVEVEVSYTAVYVVEAEDEDAAGELACDKACDGMGMDSWELLACEVIDTEKASQ